MTDWQSSAHSGNAVTCATCHGRDHHTADDVAKVRIPSPQVCAECHADEAKQFEKGKHALAWTAMKAMPTFHGQPMVLTEGMKGCGGCHKIRLKTEDEIKELKAAGSGARRRTMEGRSCDDLAGARRARSRR